MSITEINMGTTDVLRVLIKGLPVDFEVILGPSNLSNPSNLANIPV